MWLHGDEPQGSHPEGQLSIPLWRNAHEKGSGNLMPAAEVEPDFETAGGVGSEVQPKAKNHCKVRTTTEFLKGLIHLLLTKKTRL